MFKKQSVLPGGMKIQGTSVFKGLLGESLGLCYVAPGSIKEGSGRWLAGQDEGELSYRTGSGEQAVWRSGDPLS